jgi:regulator of protease activity HflC (stomatin/prohibitin superfamily)
MAANAPSNSAPSGRAGCIGALIVLALFCGVLFLSLCFTKVPPNAVGVRTRLSGGIEAQDFPPGYVLSIPGLHAVRLWDPTWTNAVRPIQVRGSDQYITSVDVSVIFRIKKDKCHVVAGQYPNYKAIEDRVNQLISLYSSEILTQMNTEDFYNSKKREAQTKLMEERMHKDFDDIGLELKSVLLRNIAYDSTFEKQLSKKQLAAQSRSVEEALTKQATGEMTTELIERATKAETDSIAEKMKQSQENLIAETEQAAAKLNQDAELQAAEITAKAQAEKRKKTAQAELLRAEATAAGTTALAKVYAKPGASYYFAKKALENMKLGQIEVNSTQFNPLDSEKLLKALGLDLSAPKR